MMGGFFKFKDTSLLTSLPSPFIMNGTVISVNSTVCPRDLFPIDAFTSICLCFGVLLLVLPITGTVYVEIIGWKIRHTAILSDCPPPASTHYGSVSSTRNDNSESKVENQSTTTSQFSIDVDDDYQRITHTMDGTLKLFSLQQNIPAVLSMKRVPGTSSTINGIRVLSLLLIICGHTGQMSSTFLIDNYLEWKTVLKNPLYLVFAIGPNFLSVDTFFVISGLLSTRSLLNMKKNSEERITYMVAMKYIYNRLIRLQPLHLYIVCVSVGLYSLVPWGSAWEEPKHELDNCRLSWWTNILLLHNFLQVENSCCPWTWYLADDFRFYLTTPLLIILYIKAKHWMIIIVGILFLILFLVSGLLSFFSHLPIRYHGGEHPSDLTYLHDYYVRPYCRYGPFLLGILLGIFMYETEEQVLKNKRQALIGWVFSLCAMFLVITLAFVLEDSYSSYSIEAAIYQALHRTIWASAVGWIIFACEQGYGGVINEILSWDIWNFLSKISYASYLAHPIVITVYIGVQETSSHFSGINMFYLFLGHCVMTLVTGFALTVLVERPFQKSLHL